MSLFKIIYNAGQNGHWVFLLLTVVMGGSAAYVTGKVIAETWRPFWQVVAYALALALAVRFLHFALFEEILVSARNFIVDGGVLIVTAIVGYAVARQRLMATQYGWPR
jgi:ABC-type iron transport system FetAB permease component